jgi:hypothetical protein
MLKFLSTKLSDVAAAIPPCKEIVKFCDVFADAVPATAPKLRLLPQLSESQI